MSDLQPAVDHRRDDAVTGETEGAVHRFDVDVDTWNTGPVGKGVLSGVLQVPLLRGERVQKAADRENTAEHADARHVRRPHGARAVRHAAGLGWAGRLREHRHGIGRAGKDRRAEGEWTDGVDRKIVPAVVPQHETRARQPAHGAADGEAFRGTGDADARDTRAPDVPGAVADGARLARIGRLREYADVVHGAGRKLRDENECRGIGVYVKIRA